MKLFGRNLLDRYTTVQDFGRPLLNLDCVGRKNN